MADPDPPFRPNTEGIGGDLPEPVVFDAGQLSTRIAYIGGVVTAEEAASPDAAGLLRAAAAGRREYASSLRPDEENRRLCEMRDALLAEAATLDAAARIVDGDYRPLYGWLPSWRWTERMDRLVLSDRGDAISADDVAELIPPKEPSG